MEEALHNYAGGKVAITQGKPFLPRMQRRGQELGKDKDQPVSSRTAIEGGGWETAHIKQLDVPRTYSTYLIICSDLLPLPDSPVSKSMISASS